MKLGLCHRYNNALVRHEFRSLTIPNFALDIVTPYLWVLYLSKKHCLKDDIP